MTQRTFPDRDTNPVSRHARRLLARESRVWVVLVLLLVVGVLAAVLQRFWFELDDYSLLHVPTLTRWLQVLILAEGLVVLPWAAVRTGHMWHGMREQGLTDEYRRTLLSPWQIVGGALLESMRPILTFIGLSLVAATAAGVLTRAYGLVEATSAHALLLAEATAFGALGMLAGGLRRRAWVFALAMGLLGLFTCAIGWMDVFYRHLRDPSPWIYAALLMNPVTAAAGSLGTDVLRFGWIYEHVRAADYFFVYPPLWQSFGCYLVMGVLCLFGVVRLLRAERV